MFFFFIKDSILVLKPENVEINSSLIVKSKTFGYILPYISAADILYSKCPLYCLNFNFETNFKACKDPSEADQFKMNSVDFFTLIFSCFYSQ